MSGPPDVPWWVGMEPSPKPQPEQPERLFPNLDADWKVIRRAADALNEVIDGVVQVLLDDVPHALYTDEQVEALTERVHWLVTTGMDPTNPAHRVARDVIL